MAPVSPRKYRGKFSTNASSTKNQDVVDTQSSTTSVASVEDIKKQEQVALINKEGEQNALPPPPAPLQRTRLKKSAAFVPHGLTDCTEAPLFVPQGIDPTMPALTMPPVPSEGKDCLMGVIQSTFGRELWDVLMVDCQSFTGEMYTTVDIIIPAMSASHCHLVTSEDTEAVAESLLQSLAALSPKVIVTPPPPEGQSQLTVTYCGADRDQLCWDYSHYGACTRMHKCQWAHAFVETFLINLTLQPLNQWSENVPVAPSSTVESEQKQGRWMPMRPPKPADNGNTALPVTNMNEPSPPDQQAIGVVEDPEEKPVRKKLPMAEPTEEKIPSRRRLLSRKNWADIEEDDDDLQLLQWKVAAGGC